MAISSPLSSLESTAKDSSKKTIAINRVLSRNIETKRNLSTSKSLFRRRRIEFGKRSSLRDRFLVPNIVVRPRGPRSLALTDTSTSVTGRLLGFIGYLSAGWILSNMPTWIALGKQFSSRLSIAGGILRNYGDESVRAMNGLTSVFGAALENISRFDFTDSSYLVRSSLNDLKTEIDALGVGLSEAFAVLLKPFKDIPEIGTIQPDKPTPTPTPTPTPPGGTGPSGAAYGVNLKALADATSQAEGTDSSVGPTTYLGHGLGRYQFMTGRSDVQSIILNNAGNEKPKAQLLINRSLRGDRSAAKQLLKYFPPSSQDSLFSTHAQNTLTQIKRRYPNADESFLVQKFGVYHLTGGDYPNSRDVNGTSGKEHGDKILREYKKLKGKSQISSPASTLGNLSSPANAILGLLGLSPQKTGQPQIAGQKRLQRDGVLTKSLGKGVDYIQITSLVGDPRSHGPHGGIDIGAPSGTYIALRVDCEVVRQGNTGGGYGIKMDLWVPEYGVQLRMAHLSGVLIQSGKIPAGTSFARVGSTGTSTGPHIHLEYDTKKGANRYGGAMYDDSNYAATLDQYVRLLLLTKNPNKGKFSPASVPSVPLVPGTPSISTETEDQVEMETNAYLAGLLNGITQERKGRKIVIIDDRKNVISQQIVSSGSGDTEIVQIPDSVLLNNFIKHKLLLDLNYT